MGEGNSFFVSLAPDSGLISSGEKGNHPFFVKFSREKSIVFQYSYSGNGVFSSAWFDTAGYVAAGSTDGKLLITRFGKNGMPRWDTTFTTSFHISLSRLIYEGDGKIVAVGTANPDSISSGMSGLLFVRFDTTGTILSEKEVTDEWYAAAGKIAEDGSGNIYVPLTTKSSTSKPRAAVAKYSPDFDLVWKTDLYNNNLYSSSSTALIMHGSYLYVTGMTQAAEQEGTTDNSYLAALNSSGSLIWKKYLEIYNTGSEIAVRDDDVMMLMNRNCFVTSLITHFSSESIPDVGEPLRLFDGCDSKNTDALSNDFFIDHEGNIIACGSLGGNFYLSVKTASQ